jgi:hypothetical protein
MIISGNKWSNFYCDIPKLSLDVVLYVYQLVSVPNIIYIELSGKMFHIFHFFTRLMNIHKQLKVIEGHYQKQRSN